MQTTTDRYLEQQAELLDSTIDTGALAKLAKPVQRARRRVPGIKINYHPHSGWFDEGPSKGPFSARVQPKERGRVDARSLITYGA